MTARTWSSSRFSARPYVSCGNSSSSPAIAFCRPKICAIPSLVATMRPTSVDTRLASKSFRRSLMTSEISFVLIPIFLPSGLDEAAAQLLQPRGDGGVDESVSVLELEAAEDARVDLGAQRDLLAETRRELARDLVALVTGQVDGGGDQRAHAPCGLVGEGVELLGHAIDLVHALGLDEQPGEVDGLLVEAVGRADETHALLFRDGRVAEHPRDLRIRHDLAQRGHLGAPVVDPALVACELKGRAGVSLSRGRRHSPPPRSPSRSAACASVHRASRRPPSRSRTPRGLPPRSGPTGWPCLARRRWTCGRPLRSASPPPPPSLSSRRAAARRTCRPRR